MFFVACLWVSCCVALLRCFKVWLNGGFVGWFGICLGIEIVVAFCDYAVVCFDLVSFWVVAVWITC